MVGQRLEIIRRFYFDCLGNLIVDLGPLSRSDFILQRSRNQGMCKRTLSIWP